ncbi:MAG TPA: DUF3011 domain-containing protein [Vicinamibacterales bacterium]|nr:DUF3011 domain-containing protein [Vicinamibacterales bacterium]
MTTRDVTRPLAILICATLLPAWPAAAQETLRCESRNHRYQYCGADTDNQVRLSRQISTIRCRQGDNWGYDRRGVWVDRGCQAEFRVGKGGGAGKDVAVAGALIAGVAIAAAIAANRDRQGEVSSWAVGNFRAYDALEDSDVDIDVAPGGAVDGHAGGARFTGRLESTRLELGRYRFRVTRSGNGFLATDESDAGHRLVFRRASY